MAGTEVLEGEAALKAELARIGVDVTTLNGNVIGFTVDLIAKTSVPKNWERRIRRLAAHAVAARIPGANKQAHFSAVGKHMNWLIARGMDRDALKELSRTIAMRMTGE